MEWEKDRHRQYIVAQDDIFIRGGGGGGLQMGLADMTGNLQQSAETTVIDVGMIAESMRKELKMLRPLSDTLCIYRVPNQVRHLNEKAYTPLLVSIGPLHHHNQNLKAMEDQKKIYLQDFLIRSNIRMDTFIQATQQHKTRLHASYATSIDIDEAEFVKMMVIDGVFIIEYLLKRYYRNWKRNDQIFNQQRLTNIIRFDILLLENQLPFFFLEHLLELSKIPEIDKEVSMINLVHHFLNESIVWNWLLIDNINHNKQVKHLVDYLAICLQPTKPHPGKVLKIRTSPTIADLYCSGVKFESSSAKHFLDIEFGNGILRIPTWKVNDSTEILLRNVMAFEQCNDDNRYVSDYVALMGLLINVPQDVELLVQNGIIENWLQDNEAVATLVNSLNKFNVISDKDFCFSGLIEDLNKYYKRPWHKWKATLKQQYFNNPWTVISVIAAAFLLLLTVIQTVCSIMQVV